MEIWATFRGDVLEMGSVGALLIAWDRYGDGVVGEWLLINDGFGACFYERVVITILSLVSTLEQSARTI